jgi:hypothetical protein
MKRKIVFASVVALLAAGIGMHHDGQCPLKSGKTNVAHRTVNKDLRPIVAVNR